jgi:hypothetical protein
VDAAAAHRSYERVVVLLVLIRIGGRERGDRLLDGVVGSEVARDRDPIAGAGMRARERPTASNAPSSGVSPCVPPDDVVAFRGAARDRSSPHGSTVGR